MVFIKHILAPFNTEERTQRCLLCGEIIHDYRNAMYAPDEQGNVPKEKGWQEGEFYMSKDTNPTYMWITRPDEIIENCI